MIRSGLVSITFRQLDAGAIIALTKRAGLGGIEWGGDVHVPHGDIRRAETVRNMTADAGLAVASYGSYYRAGEAPSAKNPDFADVLSSALALKAPVIRVWAGSRSSADADEDARRTVAADGVRIAKMAASEGIRVAFEYHRHTLTDETGSAVSLMRQIGQPNMGCCWQPPHDLDAAAVDQGLADILPWLSHIHVFHWLNTLERRPLAEGRTRWRGFFDRLSAVPGDRYALLEFVMNDDPEQAVVDAQVLNQLIEAAPACGKPDRA